MVVVRSERSNIVISMKCENCGKELKSEADHDKILNVEVVCPACNWSLDMTEMFRFTFTNNSEYVDIQFVWTTPNKYRVPLAGKKQDVVCIVRPDKAKELVRKYAKDSADFDTSLNSMSLPWMVTLMRIVKVSTYLVEGAVRPIQYLDREEARKLYPKISRIL